MSEALIVSQMRLRMIRKLRGCQFRERVECPFCTRAIDEYEAVVRADERRTGSAPPAGTPSGSTDWADRRRTM